ncbi:MAG: endonuclease [Marmoricola sp.]|nr:endonuclease [Marmoricola sp.]
MARWKYTREILQEAVDASESVAGVLRYLNVLPSGGSHAHISRSIKKFGISTAHFTGQGWNRGRTHPPPGPEHYLVLKEIGSPRTHGGRLRRALVMIGRPYRCERCANDGTWLSELIALHVDHIDGNYVDCRQENLRFLCPNCHSQTPTHAGRSRGSAQARVAIAERLF